MVRTPIMESLLPISDLRVIKLEIRHRQLGIGEWTERDYGSTK